MKFIERYPNYCDFGKPREYEVNSLTELLEVDRVKGMMSHKDFYRLSYHKTQWDGDRAVLMAEMKDGYEWWAIGWFIGELDNWVKELPKWEEKYKEETK